MSQQKFLTGEWRKLIMANYIIDQALLQSYLPAGTEPDFFNNNCYVSLVGFLFKDVRIKGMQIPWHIKFPEVNLRFYVKHFDGQQWKRGVVFISEIVPKPAITFVANTLYKEHYSTLPMRYNWIEEQEQLQVRYEWKKNNHWNKIAVTAAAASQPLTNGSEEEFITEHFWGYSKKTAGKTVEYHVEHPRWKIYTVNDYTIDCDFGSLYGEQFKFLLNRKPDSVFMAEGSPIIIFNKKILVGKPELCSGS